MSEEEEFFAQVVEDAASQRLGRALGSRTPRDAKDDSGLRVDFTYEECEPRVALEITQIDVPQDLQLVGEAEKKLESQLSKVAEKYSSGRWTVALSRGAQVKELLPVLTRLIQGGRPVRPNDYGSDDLLRMSRDHARAFVAEHRRVEALGLQYLESSTGEWDGVRCMVVGGGLISGFGDRLTERIEAKRSTLRQAQGYEGHLAVVIRDIQASSIPDKTPFPQLPAEISHVWVIHTWGHSGHSREVWLARSGANSWLRWPWSEVG